MEVIRDQEQVINVITSLHITIKNRDLEKKLYAINANPFSVIFDEGIRMDIQASDFPFKENSTYKIVKCFTRQGINVLDQYEKEEVITVVIAPQTLEEATAELEKFRSTPQAKENAEQLAYQLLREMSDKWFTAKDLMKKFVISPDNARVRLLVLSSFSLVAIKKDTTGEKYKIDLDHKVQRELLEKEIIAHKGEIQKLEKKIELLSK